MPLTMLRRLLLRLRPAPAKDDAPRYGYASEFDTWAEANSDGQGYGRPEIAQKVAAAAADVIAGRAAYERDSVVFQEVTFAFPISTAILWAASANRSLSVLDFGGGLGTSYVQNRVFLAALETVRWTIVEQATFVEQGKLLGGDSPIAFFQNLSEGIAHSNPNLAIISSSLQYVENPYEVLEQLAKSSVDMIVLDRTLFSNRETDFLTQQHVDPGIFRATIPLWIFSEQKFRDFMARRFKLVARFPASFSTSEADHENRDLRELGFLFIRAGSVYDAQP